MSELPASPPATISGKRITVVVLITLLLTGFLFYWVATSYATYNAARRQTERTWRALAVVLDERYQRYAAELDQALADHEVDTAVHERWRLAQDRFSRTTLIAQQAEAAQVLEATIDRLPQALRLPETEGPELRELGDAYAAAAETQRQVGQRAGSRMLKLMLNLPDPPEFSLAKPTRSPS